MRYAIPSGRGAHAAPRSRRRGRRLAAALATAWLLPASLAAGPAPRAMPFEHLESAEGVSLSVVNCILQDRTGFLWLGTQAGLARYDGYGFEVYRHDPGEPGSLAHDYVLALAEDPAGDLWVGTEGGGLSRWLRASDSFASYRPDPADPGSLSGLRVIALARDPGGDLWVGTMDGGLSRFDGERFTNFRHDPADSGSLAHDQLGALYAGESGDLWVGTWDGLDRFDPETESFVHYRHDPSDPSSLADPRIRALTEDAQGTLWVGTLGGLHRLERRSGKFVRYLHDPADPSSLSHDWVRALFTDRDGRLWIGTDGGLNLRDEAADGFAGYLADPGDPHSLRSGQVLALSQDRGGLLWLSTVGAGLAKWNPATWSFSHYRGEGDAAAANMVFAVSEDPEGGLWIGTFGAGLERIERPGGERSRYAHDAARADSLGDDRVTALYHDRRGALWVGTVGGGLNRLLDDGSFVRYRHDPARADSLSADGVTSLLEDRRGGLWVGTLDGGLNLFQEGVFTRFRHDPADPTSLSSDRVLALAEDSEDRLWLATDGGGLNRLHPVTGAFLRLEHDPKDASSLAADQLLAVHVAPAGRLWIGTKGRGLDRLESLDEATGRGVFVHYSRADGLPDEHISGIRSDAAGGLWLATNNGLARLDPDTGAVKSYDVSHGLSANEFNLGAHFASPSGELFFGGVSGLNAFFPERLEAAGRPPPVVLTSFTRVNQPLRFERPLFEVSEIALDHRDYAFSLEFAALDFVAPERNRYRYRLEGFQDTWIGIGYRRWASFTNLDPGRYVLRVQAAGSAGVWNEEGMRIAITVAPPPWRSWWAYGLYALALAAAIGGAGAFYRQRRQAERDRQIAEHERAIADREREGVAERERLLGERERMTEERERLIAELERKNAELERFNYTVTHDLKSPLVTIKGFLGMLRRDLGRDDRARVEHDVDRVTNAADKMQTLLEELLELSRASDPRRLARREVGLDELVREAIELVEGLSAERGVEISVVPGLPVVMADPVRLLQVYQNLLANAVHYMGDQESPRIEVGVRAGEPPAVDPVARPSRAGDVFFVRDNGQGIDPRFHRQIFELFERLDASAGGSGVGLAVVRRIVDLHGGRVWVESKGEGCGSTFCFTLGDVRPEDGEREAVAETAGQPP